MNRAAFYPLFRALSRVSGNFVGQSILENVVVAAQFLQGIGAGNNVLYSGEQAVFDRIPENTSDGGAPLCIFDVGANRGQFLTLARGQLGNRVFHVHCFEPGAKAFTLLLETAGSRPNVTANHFALGKTAGQRQLYYDTEASVFASLTKQDFSHLGIDINLCETVEVQTLDQYCTAKGVQRIDLLKIDVEGHELDVLEGASAMFGESAVALVMFEFGSTNIGTRTFMRDYFKFFRAYGMRIARITPSGYCHELSNYKDSLEQFRCANLICYKA